MLHQNKKYASLNPYEARLIMTNTIRKFLSLEILRLFSGADLILFICKFQNRAARIISFMSSEINSADVFESLGWATLE